jgi:hypothetical protein
MKNVDDVLTSLFLAPVATLLGAMARALLLFWPTMILFGAVHSHIPWVPPFGWTTCFWVVALISVLVPTVSGKDD